MSEEKELTRGEQLRRALVYERKNGWDRLDAEEGAALEAYCTGYKQFLDAGKTERECVDRAIAQAEAAGFRAYVRGMELKPGDRIYQVNRDKAIMLAVMGRKGLEHGVNIGAAHIDSPRLDLKQNPLYESDELGFFKTHYYGGIRKYQWVTIPLELHGVVALKNGDGGAGLGGQRAGRPHASPSTTCCPTWPPTRSKKPLGEAIPGGEPEHPGGQPPPAGRRGQRPGEAVGAGAAQPRSTASWRRTSSPPSCAPSPPSGRVDIGFDRSLIGAYGHDDRVCAYASLAALLDSWARRSAPPCACWRTRRRSAPRGCPACKSRAFDTFMEDLCQSQSVPLRACYEKSFCLSADVTAAYDPNFAEVYEKRNSAFVNYGMGLCKYTGARGKSGASDASAELVAYVRRVLDGAGVVWQMAELGKADQGGGGTVAVFMAERNIDTLDAGVPVLSMHAPFETVSKLDCYMTYKGMKAIYEAV